MKAFLLACLVVLSRLVIGMGVLFIIDGLLPMRSDGPNPSWREVVLGAVTAIFGVCLLRFMRRIRL
jgi:hypothetical protein